MTLEQLKENLYSKKVDQLLNSDFEYLYRNTCEYILDQYKKIENNLRDEKISCYVLPNASQTDFIIDPCHESKNNLQEKINSFLDDKNSKITQINIYPHIKQEEDYLLSLIFFKHSKLDWQSIQDKISFMTLEQKEEIFSAYFSNNNIPKSELNFFTYTFEFNLDFLTLQQLKKTEHASLLVQDLSIANGYYIPEKIIQKGFQSEYIMCMKRSLQAFEKIRKSFPQAAKYILPLAYLQKILFTVNINQLRKIKKNITDELWAQVKKTHPTIYHGIKQS